MDKAYQPRSYKSLSYARKVGLRECMERKILAYRIITLGTYYLVVGREELAKFEAWIVDRQIPINWQRDSYDTYVWKAINQDSGAVEHTLAPDGANEPEHTGIPETCKHPDCVRRFQSPADKA